MALNEMAPGETLEVILDFYPAKQTVPALMRELGYDPNDNSTDIEMPTGIGNVACAAVLEYRHHDKSNQLGDEHSDEWRVTSKILSVHMKIGVGMRR
jgi:hypothetical protein